jgi:hypothetical protein
MMTEEDPSIADASPAQKVVPCHTTPRDPPNSTPPNHPTTHRAAALPTPLLSLHSAYQLPLPRLPRPSTAAPGSTPSRNPLLPCQQQKRQTTLSVPPPARPPHPTTAPKLPPTCPQQSSLHHLRRTTAHFTIGSLQAGTMCRNQQALAISGNQACTICGY